MTMLGAIVDYDERWPLEFEMIRPISRPRCCQAT